MGHVAGSELYQLEVKLALAKFAFPRERGWRVTMHLDAMERAKGGQHTRGKKARVDKALRELRRLGVTIGKHKLFGPVDVVADHQDGALRLVEVEGKSRKQREQAVYAALGQLLLSMKIWSDGVAYGLAVPDTREWVRQLQKIPVEVTKRLRLERYLVAANGVTTLEPDAQIPDWGRR